MLLYTLGLTIVCSHVALSKRTGAPPASPGLVEKDLAAAEEPGVAPPYNALGDRDRREKKQDRRDKRREKKGERRDRKKDKKDDRRERRRDKGKNGKRVPPMNDLPGGYRISNAGEAFSGKHRGEYFEVISEAVHYDYAEVFWAPLEPIPIEVPTTKMHITGLEFNIVREMPDGTYEDASAAEAYNHHVTLTFRGTRSDGTVPKMMPKPKHQTHENGGGMHNALYSVEELTDPRTGEPIGIDFFLGAEARGTFAYTPEGYAMALDRPHDIIIDAMLINIANGGRCSEESERCPMPESALPSNGHNYNPLLECPCTDRIVKEIEDYYIAPPGSYRCEDNIAIDSLEECIAAARTFGNQNPVHTEEIDYDGAAPGCHLMETEEGSKIYFNSKTDATGGCAGQTDSDYLIANVDFLDESEAQITLRGTDVYLRMTGPADKWFAFGFPALEDEVGINLEAGTFGDLNTFTMGRMDGALAFVALTDGIVVTRKLGNHNPGEDLNGYKTTIITNTVEDGRRTVYLKYDLSVDAMESSKDAWNKVGVLNQRLLAAAMHERITMIGAVGREHIWTYHGPTRGSIKTYLLPHDVGYCVCPNDEERPLGTINGVAYRPSCNAQLLEEKNPICEARTYPGGQLCCAGGTILLDKDQSPPEDSTDTVHVKLRVYYEDGEKTEEQPKRTKVIYFAPEGDQAEYHVPVTESGEHILEEHITAESFGIRRGHPAEIVFLQGHCHAPMCISQEFWNEDTGELLCKTTMNFGTSMTEVGNEKGYFVGSSVCVWGDEEGLQAPPVVTADTRLYIKKVANSTFEHYGEMAGWLIQYHDDTL